jgi:post-segregation antitoxin (ccd killing protein)
MRGQAHSLGINISYEAKMAVEKEIKRKQSKGGP